MANRPKYEIVIFPRWSLLGGKQWHFHIKEENGQIVARGEGYWNRLDCVKTAGNLRANLYDAKMVNG